MSIKKKKRPVLGYLPINNSEQASNNNSFNSSINVSYYELSLITYHSNYFKKTDPSLHIPQSPSAPVPLTNSNLVINDS